ncbi:MAG: alpha/beta hydrolase [Alphaproteobacteria bacterium]|nr:alpha/beta hydrolase [Alphaproteobacteria bacterium]
MPAIPFDRRAIPEGAALSRWAAPDGWSLRRLDWRQPAGAPARGSLLFAGGRGDFIEKYLEAAAHWHERGWNVTSFDWRGQGGSRGDIEGGHYDSFDPVVADLDALIAASAAETPGPHVAIGHSMGGHILLRVLAERAPRLEAAVLVAPMIGINSAPMPAFAAAATASLMTAMGMGRHPAWHQSREAPEAGSLRQRILTGCAERYADELWWWEREPGYDLGAPSWGWLKAAYDSIARLTSARLAAVTLPVLLLAAEEDRLVSVPAIRWAARTLPRAELVTFPEAGHELLREADPVRLAALAAIDGFFDRHAGR